MKRKVLRWSVVFLALLGLAGCSTSKDQGSPQDEKPAPRQVTVFAAASTTDAFDELKQQFEKNHGVRVVASVGSSATLAQQIVHGAPADVYISADVAWAEYLEKEELVARRRNLLGNRLVVIVPADSPLNVQEPKDLLADELKRLAVGDPDSVPVGRYTKQVFSKLGIWDSLVPKLVPAADARQALSYVETGAAEAGVVYATDAAISPKVRVTVEIPAGLCDPIQYPAVLLKHGEDNPAAKAFYEFLLSAEAAAVFRKHGFTVLGEKGVSP